MSKPVVLITSATSRNGSECARLLLATGKCTARLGARDPSKLGELVAQGADAVVLDTTLESAGEAFKGVDVVYIILPGLVGGEEVTLFDNFFQGAKENGVKHVVYHSAMSAARSKEKDQVVVKHYKNEEVLSHSGISFTILRPTFYHENTITYYSESIKRTGELRSSAGDGVWTSVAICDIAAAAATVLTNPSEHSGKIYTLTEEALTFDELAEKLTKVIGKKVTHVNLTPEQHAELIKKHYSGPIPVEEVTSMQLIVDKAKHESRYSVVTPDLEMLLGRRGISVEDFLTQHADAFKQH